MMTIIVPRTYKSYFLGQIGGGGWQLEAEQERQTDIIIQVCVTNVIEVY